MSSDRQGARMIQLEETELKVWRDSSSHIQPRRSAWTGKGRQRSVSLPLGSQTNYGAIPSLSSVQENRTAWDRLGLYMKGLPPKHLKKENDDSSDNPYDNLEDLNLDAGKAIFSLKSDHASLNHRYETQDRHLNIIMSSLAEEITAAKAAIHSIAHDMPLVAEEMSTKLDYIQEKLARLISSSQDYGKLKYEENLSKQLEILMIYSEGLVRARESIAREIKEINENLDDDTIVMAIAKKQEDNQSVEQAEDQSGEESSEKSENIMKRLSVGLLSRRSSKKDGQESGQVRGASTTGGSSQDITAGAGGQNNTRRVTFNSESEDQHQNSTKPLKNSSTKNIHDHFKVFISDIEEAAEDIDLNLIINYVRYIVAAVLISFSIMIVLDTFIFHAK